MDAKLKFRHPKVETWAASCRLALAAGWLVLWLSIGPALAFADDLTWETDLDEALKTASAEKKPVLIDFTASWCTYCRMLEATTFQDAAVRNNLRGFVRVKVDFDHSPELVGKFKVRGVPTLVLLNRFGELVTSQTGYTDAREFYDWLSHNRKETFATVSRSSREEGKLKALGADLRNADPAIQAEGVRALVDVCVGKTPSAELAQREIANLVREKPAGMLRFLNDARLSVRIFFGNLYLENLGADFQYDPWDPADAREKVVTTWSGKLAGAQ